MGTRMTVTKRVVRLDADALAVMEEQRAFLRQSLRDLDREHEAGDLDAADYETLKHDYEARLQSVERAVAEGKAEYAATRVERSRGRRWATIAGVGVFAVLCGFGIARSAGRRDASSTITGEITKTARERNIECLNLAPEDPQKSIDCYTKVLTDAPNNVESLTYRGWVKFLNGDVSGVGDLRSAVMIDGKYPDVHAFLAIVLFQAGCASDAQAELTRLDALDPSPLVISQVEQLRTQVQAALSAPSTTVNSCGQ
jgi:hypothetical protein